jgi:hypothetical protein
MKRRLGDAWQRFERETIPAQAGAQQRHDMRAAFFSGAAAFLNITMGGLSTGQAVADADLRMMDDLATEIIEFAASVGALRTDVTGGTPQ